MALSDEQLIERVLAGDLDEFEQLVRRYREIVHRVAARVVGPDDADDVAQDTFLRAFHRLRRFRGQGSFRAWLLQIAHNTALNALSRRASAPTAADAGDPEEVQGRGLRTPAERLEATERRERLARKLGLLNPEHRAVLVLRDVEGLSYDEIATITDAPLGSVKGRLHRARSEMIDMLRNNTYDWELPR